MGMKIARGLFSLWIVALAVGLDNAHATNQHMLCKTVENVFTDEAVGPNSSRPQALQGPAGKRGPAGVKGEGGLPGLKGEKGLPGTFNPADVENMMESKLNAATKELHDRIEILEKKVTELNSTSRSGDQSAGDSEGTQCEIGIIYRQKCYYGFVHATADVAFTNAQYICEENHGKLADILDREHQRLLDNHLRAKIPPSLPYAYLWLGMLYQFSTTTVQWSDGTIVDTPLNWWGSSYPYDNSRYTNVCIRVNKDTTVTAKGLFNDTPTSGRHGAVCEK